MKPSIKDMTPSGCMLLVSIVFQRKVLGIGWSQSPRQVQNAEYDSDDKSDAEVAELAIFRREILK